MKARDFEKLVNGHRFGQEKTGQGSGRTLKAMRYHLVKGDSISKACHRVEPKLSRSALYQALQKIGQLPRHRKKLNRPSCPHCGQLLPNRTRAQSEKSTSAN